MKRLFPLVGVLLVAALAAAAWWWLYSPQPGKVASAEAGANWPQPRGGQTSWSYSPLKQITPQNVADLVYLWSAPLEPGAIQSTPIVVDGVLYVPGPNDTVVALNPVTGDQIWQYKRSLPEGVQGQGYATLPIAYGLASYKDRLFHLTLDGYLVALEARTGKPIWERQITDFRQATHAGSPLVVGDLVLSGRTCRPRAPAADCAITAHRADTGDEVWRLELGGEGAWWAGSYDAGLDLVFWGTGSGGKFPNSTLALNPKTGQIVWSVAHLPADAAGYTHVYERMVLPGPSQASAETGVWTGREAARDSTLLGGVPGNTGLVWLMDAANGQLVWARQTLEQNVYGQGLDQGLPAWQEPSQPCPSRWGRSWPASSYNPQQRALFVPLVPSCTNAEGQTVLMEGNPNLGRLQAVSLDNGQLLWSKEQAAPFGPSLTTASGLLFIGDLDRKFRAFDSQTGTLLWEKSIIAPVTGAPISYQIDGRQYISVVAGGGTDLEAVQALNPSLMPLAGSNSVFTYALPEQ